MMTLRAAPDLECWSQRPIYRPTSYRWTYRHWRAKLCCDMLTLCRVIIFMDGVCNFPQACARRQQKRVNEDSCETNEKCYPDFKFVTLGVRSRCPTKSSYVWMTKEVFRRKRGHSRRRKTWPSGQTKMWKRRGILWEEIDVSTAE